MANNKKFQTNSDKKYNSNKQTISKIENYDYSPELVKKFLEDWENCRSRHEAQEQILYEFFHEGAQYIHTRAGRKFSKTTLDIDIVWKFAMIHPNSVIYMCYPTITQAIEVVWEEKRLQRCDIKSDEMYDKYIVKTDDSKHILTFVSGSYVKLIGTWSEARGRGTQPDLLIVDELQDCSGVYLDAMDPNLAAKDGKCVMNGTPPKKRNHFHEWEDRIRINPRGRNFKFTSYSNTKVPHLKEWLDNKKIELIKAGKEDEWLREYMAEDCFSSADRVLPDAKFQEKHSIFSLISGFSYNERYPVVAISIEGKYLCAILAVFIPKKAMFIVDQLYFPQIWCKSYNEVYPSLSPKLKEIQDYCKHKIRDIVWDPSQSFQDVVEGVATARKDLKWQDRGIPLLREMMLNNKIFFANEVADFGMECQKLLRDESEKDIEKNYPYVSTLSMLVNEYFQREKIMVSRPHEFDKYQALREMGIPCPPKKKKGISIFKVGL